ncbi:type II secretion system F family protein [Weissella diestrammenae]|nr:type II secretion system F family protein [Weissella diestrammenae]MCM0582895.1 type II secretion system F family protein [Weissella diestrammenae]
MFKKQSHKWSNKRQLLFFETLNDLLRSGYTLPVALCSVSELLPSYDADIRQIIALMRLGNTFDIALSNYVSKQINLQLNFVNLHGNLQALINEISTHEFEQQTKQQKLKSLLIYPCCLIILVLMIAGGFSVLFALNSKHWLFGQSSQAMEYSCLIFCGLLTLVTYLVVVKIRCQSLLNRWLFLLKMPILKTYIKLVLDYHLTFNLGILLQSGISIAQIVQNIGQSKNDTLLTLIGESAHQQLKQGATVIQCVDSMPLLPHEAKTILSSGKSQIQIGQDFLRLAKIKRMQLNKLIERCLACLQPFCFILIGACILVLYLIYILPMYVQMGEISNW